MEHVDSLPLKKTSVLCRLFFFLFDYFCYNKFVF